MSAGWGPRGRECGVSGCWNVGKTKHSPSVHAATPTTERGGGSGRLCPRLQRSAGHFQVWLPNPSTGEKQDKKKKKKKTLYYCGFSIKAHQRAAGGKGKQRDAEKKHNGSKLPSARQRSQAEGRPQSAPTGSAPARPGKPGIGTWCWRTHSPSKPAREWACIAGCLASPRVDQASRAGF